MGNVPVMHIECCVLFDIFWYCYVLKLKLVIHIDLIFFFLLLFSLQIEQKKN